MAGAAGGKGAKPRGKGPGGGDNARPIIIVRRTEEGEAGHHGGAWKVAYADFITAMMAFFLLLWLLNVTTETQRQGLADYFTPSNALSHASSGTGRPFGGSTPFDRGSMVSNRGVQAAIQGNSLPAPQTRAMHDASQATAAGAAGAPRPATLSAKGDGGEQGQGEGASPQPHGATGTEPSPGGTADNPSPTTDQALGRAAFLANAGTGGPGTGIPHDQAVQASLAAREHAAFEAAAAQIRAAVADDPALRDLAGQLRIDETPEGLRIQLLDADKRPMFDSGGMEPASWARAVLARVAPVLAKLPENLAVTGHTDAAPYRGDAPGMSNWDLSAARANATRRLLVADGIQGQRFRSVTGMADRDLLLPADPLAAANRRIAITVLRAVPTP
jgi:chemotaxis protein MotB